MYLNSKVLVIDEGPNYRTLQVDGGSKLNFIKKISHNYEIFFRHWMYSLNFDV